MMPMWLCACASVAGLSSWARPALGIVDTEPLFRKIHDQPWSVTLEASLDTRTGNTRLTVINGQAGGRYRYGRHELLATAAVDRSIEAGRTVADSSFGHLRYRYRLIEGLWLEAFTQLGENRFQDMQVRSLAGAGPRYIFPSFHGFVWAIGLAYMFEYERLGSDPDFPRGTERYAHRWSFTSSARFDYAFFTARETLFLQPAILDYANIRVLHELAMEFHVTAHLSARWSLEEALDTIAPSDVRPLDATVKAGVKLDW
jgi:hypothetical protein